MKKLALSLLYSDFTQNLVATVAFRYSKLFNHVNTIHTVCGRFYNCPWGNLPLQARGEDIQIFNVVCPYHPKDASSRLPHFLVTTPTGLHSSQSKITDLDCEVIMQKNIYFIKIKVNADDR